MTDRLQARLAEARSDLACADHLTGLFNRRLLASLFKEHWSDILSGDGTVSVIMIDLDRFKEVNDTYGHLCGDDVLKEVARILRRSFRDNDIVARYGGDEFAVILPGVARSEAGQLAERARKAISTNRFVASKARTPIDVPLSFSVGVASCPEDGADGRELLRRADERLFEDKRDRKTRSGSMPVVEQGTGGRRLSRVAVLLIVLAAVLGMWGVLEFAPPKPPPGARAADQAREAALVAEIERLRTMLTDLTEAQEASADDQPQVDQQVNALEERIAELTAELEEQPIPGVEATVVEEVPTPTSVPIEATATPEPTRVPTPPPPTVLPTRPSAVSGAGSRTPVVLSPVVIPPQLLGHDRPRYPEIAARMRKEASVEFEVLVGADGRVIEVAQVGESVGFGFDEAARVAALSAVYRPATKDGKPVPKTVTLAITFRLDRSH